MAEPDYLATALAAATKGRTDKAETPEEDNAETHEEVSDGHHIAAREMMDCHNEGDHEGYARALHSFIRMSK